MPFFYQDDLKNLCVALTTEIFFKEILIKKVRVYWTKIYIHLVLASKHKRL